MAAPTENHPLLSLGITSPISFKTALFLIFLLTLSSRFCIGLWIGNEFLDSEYVLLARNLIHGNGLSFDGMHPAAWPTPMLPLILGTWMKLFGESTAALLMLNSLAGATNSLLCACLTRKIFGKTAAIIAGVLYALIPYLAQKEIVTESAWISLGLIAGLYLLFGIKKQRHLLNVAFSGLAFCFSYLVRPTVGVIPLFILFALIIKSYRKKKIFPLIRAIVFASVFLAGLTPWVIRNKLIFGRDYLNQSNFWYNFYKGNHRHAFTIYPRASLDNIHRLYPRTERPPVDEFKLQDGYFQKSKDEMRAIGLGGILSASLKKLFFLWNIRMVPYMKRIENPVTHDTIDQERGIAQNLAFTLPYLFIVCFAFLGCWQIRRRMPQLIIFSAGFLFVFSLPYMLTFAYSRYAVPAYFILIIPAAKGLLSLKKSLSI